VCVGGGGQLHREEGEMVAVLKCVVKQAVPVAQPMSIPNLC
jgi:hypothetical protein